MQVKDTYLSKVQVGDILAWRNRGDLLGNLISTFEPHPGIDNQEGRYKDIVHVAFVRRTPDPTAEVIEVKPGIYAIKTEVSWNENEQLTTPWEDELAYRCRLFSNAGIKLEATNPYVQENVIDWSDPHMLVWRIHGFTPEMIDNTMLFADDMLGYEYDTANFLTFGNVRRAHATICSELVANSVYNGSLAATKHYGFALTPDIAGNKDMQKTPNDIGNSGLIREIKFQGKLE